MAPDGTHSSWEVLEAAGGFLSMGILTVGGGGGTLEGCSIRILVS